MGKLFKAILGVFKRILRMIVNFVKKYWWVILMVVAIYFAPVISSWLTSAGAPSWLSGAFSWVAGNVTPYVTSLVTWLGSSAGSVVGSVGSWFSSLSFSQQAAVALGAAALIAPQETADVIDAGVGAIGDVVGTVGAAIAGSVLSQPLVWVAAGLALWLLWPEKDDQKITIQAETPQGGK